LENPSYVPNLKSLASAVTEILKANPKFREAPLARTKPTFLSAGFDAHAKFEVAGFICYGNIREFVFK